MQELHLKYRPNKLKDMIGQDTAVKTLQSMLDNRAVKHSMMFTGASGCGKTTMARCVAKELLCLGTNYREINSANFRGIDTVRDIQSTVNLSPMGGKTTFYVIDEAHKLTKDAQEALLKILEECPPHAYFILCTTDPGKLIAAIKTRCTEIRVMPLKDEAMKSLLIKICQLEQIKLDKLVGAKILELAAGSARKAIVLLDQARHIADPKEQLNSLQSTDIEKAGIDIAGGIFNKSAKWEDIAKLIKEVDDEPESIRRIILGYATSILLSQKDKSWIGSRAFLVINVFRDHWYDCGRAGLAASCWEIFNSK